MNSTGNSISNSKQGAQKEPPVKLKCVVPAKWVMTNAGFSFRGIVHFSALYPSQKGEFWGHGYQKRISVLYRKRCRYFLHMFGALVDGKIVMRSGALMTSSMRLVRRFEEQEKNFTGERN